VTVGRGVRVTGGRVGSGVEVASTAGDRQAVSKHNSSTHKNARIKKIIQCLRGV
jgi:hypothetical protein